MYNYRNQDLDPGSVTDIAIVVTVLVAFFSAAVSVGGSFSLATWAALIALGGIHLLLIILLSKYFFDGRHAAFKTIVYFLIQLGLCGAIHAIGRAQFWLLFLPLTSQAVYALSRKGIAVFIALVLVLFLIPIGLGNLVVAIQWVLIFLSALVFVLIFTGVSIHDQKARREVERLARELEQANQRLRESAVQAEELARSRERNRLAREIHDSLGHYLTVVNIQLEAAKALVESRGWKETAPELFATLEKAHALTRNGLDDVRRSVAALRADPMGDKPFLDAVQTLIAEHQETGLLVFFKQEGEMKKFAPQTELTLYRSLQEALTNVRKHARASRVDVLLRCEEKAVRLEVLDNGIGLAADEEDGEKFGLRGMRERVELLKGKLQLGQSPDGGVWLMVELPI